MLDNIPHYYRNIDFAVSAVNGAPSMRGCPGGKLTSIGDLQVRYFQPGGVPVESWDSFYLLCNILCDISLLGGLKNMQSEVVNFWRVSFLVNETYIGIETNKTTDLL